MTLMKQFSDETRKRMSESAKKRCTSPDWLKMQHERGTKLNEDEVRYLYYDCGMSQSEVGLTLGVSQKVVYRYMLRHDMKARPAVKRNQLRENNSYWHGGKVVDDAGYILIKCDEHPRAKKYGGYVREHILVAEKILGRNLMPDEVVHHINEIKSDNRPENLAVMNRSEHIRYHALKKYGKEAPEPISLVEMS